MPMVKVATNQMRKRRNASINNTLKNRGCALLMADLEYVARAWLDGRVSRGWEVGLQAALFLALTSADYCVGIRRSIMEGGEICGRSQMVPPLS